MSARKLTGAQRAMLASYDLDLRYEARGSRHEATLATLVRAGLIERHPERSWHRITDAGRAALAQGGA